MGENLYVFEADERLRGTFLRIGFWGKAGSGLKGREFIKDKGVSVSVVSFWKLRTDDVNQESVVLSRIEIKLQLYFLLYYSNIFVLLIFNLSDELGPVSPNVSPLFIVGLLSPCSIQIRPSSRQSCRCWCCGCCCCCCRRRRWSGPGRLKGRTFNNGPIAKKRPHSHTLTGKSSLNLTVDTQSTSCCRGWSLRDSGICMMVLGKSPSDPARTHSYGTALFAEQSSIWKFEDEILRSVRTAQ